MHRYLSRALALRSWYGDDHELVRQLGVQRFTRNVTPSRVG
jgi:hypothetical protein